MNRSRFAAFEKTVEAGTTASTSSATVAETSWENLFKRLTGRTPPRDLFSRLTAAYAAPERRYHTLSHVAFCLDELETIRDRLEFPDECALALWFHDAVYDPHAHDNEEKSADWAVGELSAVAHPSVSIERIRHLIMDTSHRQSPTSADGACLVDIDLAILGQAPEQFQVYEDAIRQEYSWVPWARFKSGRIAILKGFLARTPLFHTEPVAARYELQARINLTWAIERLEQLSDDPASDSPC